MTVAKVVYGRRKLNNVARLCDKSIIGSLAFIETAINANVQWRIGTPTSDVINSREISSPSRDSETRDHNNTRRYLRVLRGRATAETRDVIHHVMRGSAVSSRHASRFSSHIPLSTIAARYLCRRLRAAWELLLQYTRHNGELCVTSPQ